MSKEFNISLLSEYPNRIIWNINRNCNLKCEYCYYSDTHNKNKSSFLSPEEIEKAFEKTNKKWLILLSGGEPFIYQDIYKILNRLSQKHTLQITTNLLACDTEKLVNSVSNRSVMMISASYHVTQKTNHQQIDEFIIKYHFLKQNNFHILVNYVSYPPLLTRVDEDYKYLKSHGIDNFTILTYRGIYKGKQFPGSYTKHELDIIRNYSLDDSETLIATANTNFYRHYCDAGYCFFSMDENGNISRCGTINKSYGNLFKGTFVPDDKAKPCTAKLCLDCYLGMTAVKNQKSSIFSMFFKKIV